MIDRLPPPLCGRVRLLVAAITLAVAIPRLPVFSAVNYAALNLFDAAMYGYALLPIGLALAVTSYRWRLRAVGRFIAVMGFVAWVTLAFATLSVTSRLIDIILAGVLMLEIIDRHDC